MPTLAEQMRIRQDQWNRFAHWQAHDDPATRMQPADSLHWAGEMLAWHLAREGPADAPRVPADYAGVQIMRKGLALLHSAR